METLHSELPEKIKMELSDPPDLMIKSFTVGEKLELSCLYLTTLINKEQMEELVFCNILSQRHALPENQDSVAQWLLNTFAQLEVKPVHGLNACMQEMLEGKCIVLPNVGEGVSINIRKQEQRSITEPEMESVVRGPREGFVEDWSRNVSLIRKRVKNGKLAIEKMIIGTESNTSVCLLFIRGIAAQGVVDEFRIRLKAIQTDSILESSYIEEFIQDNTLTPFPQFIASERPDAIVAKLLEGQVAIITDGTPIVLAGPITFFQLFSAPEDYYQRADIATLLRWLRMSAFIISIFTPALYISVASFHQDLLPGVMLSNLAAQREGVPFPGAIEAFLMLFAFEIIREAGLRMPRIAGQAISIVGALVLGQAAVEAGIVSAAMIIVVSITAIANFVAPTYGFGIAQRIIQFVFMISASFLGFYGLVSAVFFLLLHVISLEPFGVPFFTPLAPIRKSDWRDSLIRVPRQLMKGSKKNEKR
ncbi:spore germination protein [Paenibacillus sp. 5J-6]|uniref:Spore germination protein n=1 Tax=Paenibacillus silvestris TaxID=2606219 RepID=A0A6L8V1X8_9BACL|nr:spore germination protein [Paenibacillus silvestris]MZQ83269.1 spore germination protein [Paenibacillus silvestris]